MIRAYPECDRVAIQDEHFAAATRAMPPPESASNHQAEVQQLVDELAQRVCSLARHASVLSQRVESSRQRGEQDKKVQSLAQELKAAQQKLDCPLPNLTLSNGSVFAKEELKKMVMFIVSTLARRVFFYCDTHLLYAMQVPNYEWDTFFNELLKIKPKASQVDEPTLARGAPDAPDDIHPTMSPSQTNVPLDHDELPLPEGWSKDLHEGKPLYGACLRSHVPRPIIFCSSCL